MQPLNPFLRSFFRSALPSQCLPIQHHILLVPATDVLLHSKDRESNVSYAELSGSEDFLASHVLRVPGGVVSSGNGKDGGNVRETKGKAKQYSTINGRTVVVKDAFVYSNKGFKTLNQAQLLNEAIFYPDSSDGQQWLVYYISRPLIGSYQATPIIAAVISDIPSTEKRNLLAEATGSASSETTPSPVAPKKKDIKSFSDLLNHFPMISRQMQGGLEKILREFARDNDKPIQKRRSRSSSFSSQRSAPSISESMSSLKSSLSGSGTLPATALELDPEEETMRASLETAITSAIELFQNVDKQQLSMLGASTELTGPVVERMIERYVTEQVHDQILFPRVCAIRRPDDLELDSRIRKMVDVDIAQVGIPIEDGMKGKRDLALRLAKGVEVFKKMGVASSSEQMLDILLDTEKIITANDASSSKPSGASDAVTEKPGSALTINADTLVSMLLVVVIRSGVRHLHSRLLYMRYFIFIDEVESGEQGYALSTLEAVLSYLSQDSGALRKASKRNKALWQATKAGDLQALEVILEPGLAVPPEVEVDSPDEAEDDTAEDDDLSAELSQEDQQGALALPEGFAHGDFAAVGGSLTHVFPFQKPPTPPPDERVTKAKKRVSMASFPRSASISSGYSSRSHSRTKSMDSAMSTGLGSDTSVEKLSQTQDLDGNSVLMMAVEARANDALKYLLSLPAHFRIDLILDDCNNEGTTLLSAAVQSSDRSTTDTLLEHLFEHVASEERLEQYFAAQDSKGRCFAHYLFNQPHLLDRIGKKLPWRLKDKNGQTPLFALCRSYDHEEYHEMVDKALLLATEMQGDGEPLHLDDHVDAKGNTLLHIVNDPPLTIKLLRYTDSDVNAANDRRFTPLMVASKYGRIDLVRAFFGDPRVEMQSKDLRGLTAVELAKDDDVRNRIDDLVLLSCPPSEDGRTTTLVRSFFVEDATVRLVLKSGAPNANGTITVTTCRRSVTDFENLAKWLAIECPASWLPTHFNLPSPFLIPSKPSRAILRDIQIRLDNLFRSLLTHGTFSTHELVWEFFLVPEIDSAMLTERSKRKAEARVDNVKEDFAPITDTHEVQLFVTHAKEQIRGVSHATKTVIRRTNQLRRLHADLSEAQMLAASAVSTLAFLPQNHIAAYERYSKTLIPTETAPFLSFYYAVHSILSTSTAIQVALNRPAYLIGSMTQAQKSIDRQLGSLSRSSRWTPNIGLFDDTRRSIAQEAFDKSEKARSELESLGCELRYTQQTVAQELAAWQDQHVKSGRRMLRALASSMVVKERARLEGMKRALRELRK